MRWREVPTNNDGLGDSALATEPDTAQLFVKPSSAAASKEVEFETQLYVLRQGGCQGLFTPLYHFFSSTGRRSYCDAALRVAAGPLLTHHCQAVSLSGTQVEPS